ncbi:LysR family transcriptional regulator [Streptomyces violaceusniger]|uniref:Transcriptional regulator n=1 Tax=Streptomyces violaceusniger TaxID=68280 RepID=A0A4D4LKN8_STRVO|nr:transcriptional regulator [Streptomyces violaceusniger]
MDIQQIRYFLAVAEELHFARAAERLHVTPSPLSRRIKELERELGSDLFVRGYHRVELTPLGRAFVDPAREVVCRFDALKDLSPDPAAATRRTCRIGAATLAAPQALDAVLEVFHTRAPEVDLPLTLAASAELLPALQTGALDLAVVHLPPGAPELESLPLVRGRLAIAMRTGDPLAARDRLTLADLRGREVVATSSKVHPSVVNSLHRRLRGAGVTRLVELPHNDSVQVAARVRRTGVLSLTLKGLAHPSARVFDDPDFAVVPLDEPGLFMDVGAVWCAGSEDRVPGLAEVLAELRRTYGAAPLDL